MAQLKYRMAHPTFHYANHDESRIRRSEANEFSPFSREAHIYTPTVNIDHQYYIYPLEYLGPSNVPHV